MSTAKTEKLKTKIETLQAQLREAEAAERKALKEAEQRERARRQRLLTRAAERAGLLALTLDDETLEAEFSALVRKYLEVQEPLTETAETKQEATDDAQATDHPYLA